MTKKGRGEQGFAKFGQFAGLVMCVGKCQLDGWGNNQGAPKTCTLIDNSFAEKKIAASEDIRTCIIILSF